MEKINYYTNIGLYIKQLREKINMSRSQLADGICSISYITRIEHGERCPTSVILRQLTNKLGVNPEYLFRAIESPNALDIKKYADQLIFYIERDDFKNIIEILENFDNEKLVIESIFDLQDFRGLKCISLAMLNHNYRWGMNQLNEVLALTYKKRKTPTDSEFIFMATYDFFLLLDNQNEAAYRHLVGMKKYLNEIKSFSTHAIIPKYYVFLISACLDMSNFSKCFEYLDFSIDYCKEHNSHNLLRELYYLKGELYYHLKEEKKFELWYNKAITLHMLIKNSDSEYFEEFVKMRLNKLKNS